MQQTADTLLARSLELEDLLQNPDVLGDRERLKTLTKEYTALTPALAVAKEIVRVDKLLAEAKTTLDEEHDAELLQLAQEEHEQLTAQRSALLEQFAILTAEHDPLEEKNIIVEIRAGAGGDEAALFAAELFRMYSHFAEKRGWKTKLLSSSRTGIGGLKEVIFEIAGQSVYRHLRFESGVHRVQRVPETEKSGRVHTSTVTVVVLPEAEEVDIELRPEDLNIEATTSSGHGGQSVNTTYSAVRITHLPTGIVVTCQDERSQKQNKERALQVMRARLFAAAEEKRRATASEQRKSQIGTGDRSEKIRTYNIPQDRVTDHRIKQNFPAVTTILDGNLDAIVAALREAEQKMKN